MRGGGASRYPSLGCQLGPVNRLHTLGRSGLPDGCKTERFAERLRYTDIGVLVDQGSCGAAGVGKIDICLINNNDAFEILVVENSLDGIERD